MLFKRIRYIIFSPDTLSINCTKIQEPKPNVIIIINLAGNTTPRPEKNLNNPIYQ